MVVGSVHLVETFEFFHTLRKNNWEGVWQLDQFPFREDTRRGRQAGDPLPQGAARRARRPRRWRRCAAAQASHDALAAQRLVQKVLLSSMARASTTDDRAAQPNTPPCRCSAGFEPHAQPRRADRPHRRGGPADPDPGPQAGPLRRRRAHRRRLLGHRHPGDPVRRRARTSPPRPSTTPSATGSSCRKGHVAGALYTTLAAFGFLRSRSWPPSCKPLSRLNGHPNRTKVRGVEANTGPLGHGLPIAVGHALVGQARRLAAPDLRARRRRRAAGGQQLGGDDGGLPVRAGSADRDRGPQPAAAGRDHRETNDLDPLPRRPRRSASRSSRSTVTTTASCSTCCPRCRSGRASRRS